MEDHRKLSPKPRPWKEERNGKYDITISKNLRIKNCRNMCFI